MYVSVWYICIYKNFLIHSPVVEYLDCFYIMATVLGIAMNIDEMWHVLLN